MVPTGRRFAPPEAAARPRCPRSPAYQRRRTCYDLTAPNLVNRGAKGDRHGQGSDAQQQGKEKTEGRQEPQKGRRRAGQSVRGGQDPGRPKPRPQQERTLSV